MPPKKINLTQSRLARALFFEAVVDLEASKALLEHKTYKEAFSSRALFLAQQAVEKAIKAILVGAGQRPDRNYLDDENIQSTPDSIRSQLQEIVRSSQQLLKRDAGDLRYPRLDGHSGLKRPYGIASPEEAFNDFREACAILQVAKGALDLLQVEVRIPWFTPEDSTEW